MPNGWDEVAGGFPAMTNNVPFLVKDVALLAASFYLLKQEVVRAGRRRHHQPSDPGPIATTMAALGLLRDNLEYHVLRAAMVPTFFAAFSYTKWHQYGAQLMIPFISHSPFIFWLYPAFGTHGGAQLPRCVRVDHLRAAICRFWDKRLGALGRSR